jgi:hypothetical protein
VDLESDLADRRRLTILLMRQEAAFVSFSIVFCLSFLFESGNLCGGRAEMIEKVGEGVVVSVSSSEVAFSNAARW